MAIASSGFKLISNWLPLPPKALENGLKNLKK